MDNAAAASTEIQVCIIVPCFNEARRLAVDAFRDFAHDNVHVRIVFVDDGSTDATPSILRDLSNSTSGRALIDVLSMPANVGKAEAVRAGLRSAIGRGAEVVGFWDADLATPLTAIGELLEVLRRRPDIDWVLAARVQLLGRDIRRRAARHYLGRVFATAASFVLGMPVYDTQCGAKLFRVSPELMEVLARPFVSRWVFDVEMISRYAKIRSRDGLSPAVRTIYEHPLQEWQDVAGSKVRGGDFVKAAIELFRIRFDRIAKDPARGSGPASPLVP